MRGRRVTDAQRAAERREREQARRSGPLEKAARAAMAAFQGPNADPFRWDRDVTPGDRERWRSIAQAAVDAHAKETRERQNVREACERVERRTAAKRRPLEERV